MSVQTEIPTRRLSGCTVVPLASLGSVGLAMGAAGSATTTVDTPNVTLTIHNDTDEQLILTELDLSSGRWLRAPQAVLAPGETQIVTAYADSEIGLGLEIVYSVHGTDAYAVFVANNYGFRSAADTYGTHIDGPQGTSFGIRNLVTTGFPDMEAGYRLVST